MDTDSSSLYMCPCSLLFLSLEDVLTHQLTCLTSHGCITPNPSSLPSTEEEEPAEMYAEAPCGPPAGPVQHSADQDQQQPPLDGVPAIVPGQAPGQSASPSTPPASVPGPGSGSATVAAAKPNGLRVDSGAGSSSAAAAVSSGSPGQRTARPGGTPPAPLIRYQCGECSLLFESMALWQRHSDMGMCCPEGAQGGATQATGDAGPGGVSEGGEGGGEVDETEGMAESVRAVAEGDGAASSNAAAAANASSSSEPAGRTSFLCMSCGAALGSQQALVRHRKARHGLEKALHVCQVCGEEFMNTTVFLYHQRQHKDDTSTKDSKAANNKATGAEQGEILNIELLETVEAGAGTPSPSPSPSPAAPLPTAGHPSADTPPDPCPHCGQAFKRHDQLRVHMRSHLGVRPYKCNLCPKAFIGKANLARHKETHDGERCHVCDRCGQAFFLPGALARHMTRHTQEDRAAQRKAARAAEKALRGAAEKALTGQSQDAGENGEQGEKVKKKKGGGGKRTHACPDCHYKFFSLANLEKHRSKGMCCFPCSECGQTFRRKRRLDLHALLHQGKQPIQCPSCPEQFLSQSELEVHQQVCPRKWTWKRPFRRRQGGKVSCELCGHRCMTQQSLELHRLSHAGVEPLRCPHALCRGRFATEEALQSHLAAQHQANSDANNGNSNSGAIGVANDKPRPFRCEDCDKTFTSASSLIVHVRIHTGERPYQCKQCNKRFRQLPHLRDHERLHTGKRPFVCNVCGRSFVLPGRLTEHARIHSGEKPYSCQLCHATFRSLSNLGKHRKTHALQGQTQQQPLQQGYAAPRRDASAAQRQSTVRGSGVKRETPGGDGGGGGSRRVVPTARGVRGMIGRGEGEAAVHTILIQQGGDHGSSAYSSYS